jgi:serine/threonine protein phosphatase PrpC
MTVSESRVRGLKVTACTGQHRGDRAEQQDRVAVLQGRHAQRCALGVLADGLGGRSGGALAAENVILTAQRCFDAFSPSEESPAHFFTTLVDEVHAILRLTALATDKEPHSTFASVLVQPDRIDWCHVGDSRIYHFRGAQLQHCSADHTYAWQLVVEGRMSPERARLNPRANMLVNSIGGQNRPWADIGSIEDACDEDSFLLCSDGLWAYFDPEELGQIIVSRDCRSAAAELIEIARKRARGRGDNCSLVLFKIG